MVTEAEVAESGRMVSELLQDRKVFFKISYLGWKLVVPNMHSILQVNSGHRKISRTVFVYTFPICTGANV